MRSLTRLLSWLGLGLSLALLVLAVWSHLQLDPMIRVLPVLIFGGAGLLLGAASLQGLLAGSSPPQRWTRPAPESHQAAWGLLFGVALIAAGADGLLAGSVRTPNLVFQRALERAESPGAYWGLTGIYLVGGAGLAASGASRLARIRKQRG